MLQLPTKVQVNDVLLRDGLQLEEKLLSVDEKFQLLQALVAAHVNVVEFGSFVHPKFVPQMANSGELFAHAKTLRNVQLISLVPNRKGVERAAAHGVKIINFVFSASNTHNMQNVRKTTRESLAELATLQEYCTEQKMQLNASIATTFGCPFEGEVKPDTIVAIVKELTALNITYITLADTTGVANPKQVYTLMVRLTNDFPDVTFNMHFHNTRGLGLANVLASLQAGITHFDAALGGLGGCPFAPGATGNIATEDLVYMLAEMGIDTAIDLDQLLDAAKLLKSIIGHDLDSSVFKAGKASRRYPVEEL